MHRPEGPPGRHRGPSTIVSSMSSDKLMAIDFINLVDVAAFLAQDGVAILGDF